MNFTLNSSIFTVSLSRITPLTVDVDHKSAGAVDMKIGTILTALQLVVRM